MNNIKHFKNREDLMRSLFDNSMDDIYRKTMFTKNVPSNTYEFKDKFLIELSLPGYNKKDIDINIENDLLIISGERKTYEYDDSEIIQQQIRNENFKKTYELNKNIDVNNIQASLDNGILKITIYKKEKEDRNKKIQIE